MADIHIEEFYKDAAIALVQLYNAFPRRVNLFVEDIAGPDEPDEFGLHSKRHMACFGTLLWLAEEGLLRYVDTIRQVLDKAGGQSIRIISKVENHEGLVNFDDILERSDGIMVRNNTQLSKLSRALM